MSMVRLVAITAFRWDNKERRPRIVLGAQDVHYDGANLQWVFRAGNIPVDHPAGRLPAKGRTFFYGFQDAIKEVANWQRFAEQNDLYFHSCYFDVEVGDIFPALSGHQELATHRFASMRRLKTDVLDNILDFYREKSARPSVELKGMARYADIASTPWLLDDLLAQPDYAGIDVMVYPVQTGRGIKNFAFVRQGCVAANTEQNLQLPWRIEF